MPTEPDNNRSSALSPEALGAINSATAAAVQTAISAMFAGMLPVFKGMELTPEKMQALKQPYVDPKAFLREQRESLKSKADEAEIKRMNDERKAACTHTYNNGITAINLCHNAPDRQPRGVCVTCGDWIHPREWRIGVPTDEFPRGKAYIVEAHKDYKIVMQIEARS